MELRQLWNIGRRRWWLILLPSLAALAYAMLGYTRTPPAGGFTTAIRFTAAEPAEKDAEGYEDSSYYPWLASEYVVNALTDWSKTSSFAEEVSTALASQDVEIPASALQGRISADNERSVMVLYLSWHNPEELAAIASAASQVLETRSSAYFPQVSAVRVVALDEPAIAPVPPPLSSRFDPIIRFGLGLAAGIALAFLFEYLDPTLRDRREVEAMGLRVLVEVPRE
jgi:capsular polysaccharide biosynthesis protein